MRRRKDMEPATEKKTSVGKIYGIGCGAFILVILILGLIFGIKICSVFMKFTEDEPLRIQKVEFTDEEVAELEEKIKNAQDTGEPTVFTEREVNILLLKDDKNENTMLYCDLIPGKIDFKMSIPSRKKYFNIHFVAIVKTSVDEESDEKKAKMDIESLKIGNKAMSIKELDKYKGFISSNVIEVGKVKDWKDEIEDIDIRNNEVLIDFK
ncbi:MAG: hypothetical protein ACOCWM_06380 [Cyclobacteriaceae bacterium]